MERFGRLGDFERKGGGGFVTAIQWQTLLLQLNLSVAIFVKGISY
jgi:hypothetical protein